MEKILYFIAILPNGICLDELQKMKKWVSEKFNSHKALNSPPHITLHMPFKQYPKNEDQIIKSIEAACENHAPFSVAVNGFGAFPPRVLYVKVEENELLRRLQKEIAQKTRLHLYQFNDTYRNKGFHPHITIAFRDLKKEAFASAWSKLQNKSYQSSFDVKEVCLLKHTGKNWMVYKKFPLLGK